MLYAKTTRLAEPGNPNYEWTVDSENGAHVECSIRTRVLSLRIESARDGALRIDAPVDDSGSATAATAVEIYDPETGKHIQPAGGPACTVAITQKTDGSLTGVLRCSMVLNRELPGGACAVGPPGDGPSFEVENCTIVP